MVSVTWEKGRESGFIYKSAAQRFIERVCKVAAPDFNYLIDE